MYTKFQYRVVFTTGVLLLIIFLIVGNISAASNRPYSNFEKQAEKPPDQRDVIVEPRDNITVATSHLGDGVIFATQPNGKLLYYNDSHDGYWDVDQSPIGRRTVLYTATDEVDDRSLCKPVGSEAVCIRQMIERVNLTTGETTVLYSRVDGQYLASEWHDVDWVSGSKYIVADMEADEVFIVNVSTGLVVWEWNAQNYLSLDTGGPFPKNWVHLNDVEVLDDGRIMVSLRNQDQVVFLDPESGVIDDWTLGSEDDYSTLYEQHNPDYIPSEQGGPAVLVADSENNRIVEYQRTASGGWEQTWQWQDSKLSWGRDADRLPNGHTLISDTHGGRIIEIDTHGEIVWQLNVPFVYEAERLGTGDESTGGPSAVSANLTSRFDATETGSQRGIAAKLNLFVQGLLPAKVVNAIWFVTPYWVGFYDVGAALAGLLLLVVWIGIEVKWAGFRIRSPIFRTGRE